MRSGRKRKSSRAGRKSDRPPQNEPNQEEEQAQAQEEQENVDNEQNNEVEEEDDQTEEEEDPEDNEVTANFDGFSVGTSSPTFYAFPGQRNAGKIIDYDTKNGRDHYEKATAVLDSETYDCGADGFFQFSKDLARRAQEFGWSRKGGIGWMKKGDEKVNIFTDYGRLTLAEVKVHAATYMSTESRKSQDDLMLYTCIMNSLDRSGKLKINVRENDFKIGEEKLPSGVTLFKIVVQESHIDSNATTAVIRGKMQNLSAYMQEVGNDIQKFNNYVIVLMESLAARGETSSDIMFHLFTAYGTCSDQLFVKYMEDRLSEYEDGKEFTWRQIMEKALAKYKTLRTKNLWEAQTDDQKKLIALEAEVQSLKRGKGQVHSNKNQKRNRTRESGQRSSKRRKGQSGHSNKTPKKEKPKWMFERPAELELFKSKKWNGKTWYYCAKCTGGKCDPGRYTVHKPSECRGKEFFKRDNTHKKTACFDRSDKNVVIKQAIDEISGGYVSSGSE